MLLHPQNVADDLRQYISEKYEIPSDHLAIARVYNNMVTNTIPGLLTPQIITFDFIKWGVVKLLELASVKWDPTSRVCPRDGDLVFWCDTREPLKELTPEEKKQLQKSNTLSIVSPLITNWIDQY